MLLPQGNVVFIGRTQMRVDEWERLLLALLISGVTAWVTIILTEDKK